VAGPGTPPDFPGDDSNPYAPPTTKADMTSRPRARGEVPFDLGCILRATWAVFREQPGTCLGVGWTVFVLAWASQFVQNRVMNDAARQGGGQFQVFLLQFSVFFGVFVFNVWLNIGQNLALLRLVRHEPSPFESVFRGGRFLLTTILAWVVFALLLGLIAFLSLIWVPILLAGAGQGGPIMILVFAVGIGTAVIVMVYVGSRFSQYQYMILDQNAGVLDSLRDSWEATRGRVATLLLVFMLWFSLILGGLVACLVGILFTGPFASLMLAVAYLSLTGQPIGRASQESEIWDQDVIEES
jgi:hypothetical protein